MARARKRAGAKKRAAPRARRRAAPKRRRRGGSSQVGGSSRVGGALAKHKKKVSKARTALRTAAAAVGAIGLGYGAYRVGKTVKGLGRMQSYLKGDAAWKKARNIALYKQGK